MARRALVVGNWKMHGTTASLAELRTMIAASSSARCEVAVCPPLTLLPAAIAEAAGSAVAIGAQDCSEALTPFGAFTGDISAEMIADLGARLAIVGHSERRTLHGETDTMVRAKAGAAARAGLTAIVCIGETAEERREGKTETVLSAQLAGSLPERPPPGLVVAYEPVWAIGTGFTPTGDEIAAAHSHIRLRLAEQIGREGADATRILYGGSVKANNAREIAAVLGVDGALVGGASLKAAEFLAIVAAFG